MKENQIDIFQSEVEKLLVRNSNVLDILTKIQSSGARICRSTVKSATGCGCLTFEGKKREIGLSANTGISGKICEDCQSNIENEIGEILFYIASLCNVLGLSLNDIMVNECSNVKSLGKYSLR